MLGDIGTSADRVALIIFAGDEVDYAADGVGAIHRRGPVAQYFHAFDGGKRDRVQIHHLPGQTVCRHAAAIQQYQGGIGSLPPQIGTGHTIVAASAGRSNATVGGKTVRSVTGHIQLLQQLFRRGNALGINFRALDDGDRQRRFNVGALDARSGHRHAIQSFDLAIGTAVFGVSLLRHDGHGQGGQQRKAQAAHMECGA